MNRWISFTASALLAATTGLALAQSTAPVVTPGTSAPTGQMGVHPRVHEIHERIRLQRARIEGGIKSGKITKDEAKPLWDVLKSVHDQMQSDFKQNGKIELSEEQQNQLNQLLDENSKNIHDEKQEGSANTSTNGSTSSTTTSTSSTTSATEPSK